MTPSLRKYLLWPFGILYGSILAIRNLFYNKGWLSSYQSSIFTISVGNLSMGGTGKTPMVEYLVRALSPQYKTAILSRGYGRKNLSEVLIASTQHTADDLGDEPMQYHSKFPDVSVVVASNRTQGAQKIEAEKPDTELIILDDAFQHRGIRPHLSILLTDYSHLYTKDAVVPAGNLREFACGAKRAHIIVTYFCRQTNRNSTLFRPIPCIIAHRYSQTGTFETISARQMCTTHAFGLQRPLSFQPQSYAGH